VVSIFNGHGLPALLLAVLGLSGSKSRAFSVHGVTYAAILVDPCHLREMPLLFLSTVKVRIGERSASLAQRCEFVLISRHRDHSGISYPRSPDCPSQLDRVSACRPALSFELYPINSRVPGFRAACRRRVCHGRRTHCPAVRPLASTCAKHDHRRRCNIRPTRAW